LTYVIRRLLYSSVVLVVASFLVFSGMSLVADPLAPVKMQRNVSQQTIENITKRKHLDQPIPVRYLYWLEDATTNGFGTYVVTDEPILPDLKRVIGHTLQLVIVAQLLAVLVGVGIGIYSALRQYSVGDYAATAFSFAGLAIPAFWLALMLQILFINIYLWFDVRIFYTANLSSVEPGSGFHLIVDRIQHLGLPWIVLMVAGVASYSRYMRSSMLEVVDSDYVRTARAKGLGEKKIIMKHAFRNALIPVVTILAIDFGGILNAAVVTETIFGLDGMGLFLFRALTQGDPYPIMACLMVLATMIVTFNLIADILYGYLDPRVRFD
jgi:peptide/nickel transport system permease protein